jgi:hypothetical protein
MCVPYRPRLRVFDLGKRLPFVRAALAERFTLPTTPPSAACLIITNFCANTPPHAAEQARR